MPTLFRLKVHPDSGKNRLVRIVESKRLRVARGATSPNKIVEVLGT